MTVIPDEIYITITLRERYDGREKISVDQHGTDIEIQLTALNMDFKNLSLSDATAIM